MSRGHVGVGAERRERRLARLPESDLRGDVPAVGLLVVLVGLVVGCSEASRVDTANGLPNVLILGDSISIGYTPVVREELAGRANVSRPMTWYGEPVNNRATGYALEHVDDWLGDTEWDLIHFNWGLHDLMYVDRDDSPVPPSQGQLRATPAEYRRNLEKLVERLEATGAVLIFATLTPVPEGAEYRDPADPPRYNAVALELMATRGIEVNDLFAVVTESDEALQLPENVHFSEAGYRRLGETTASAISTRLARREGVRQGVPR